MKQNFAFPLHIQGTREQLAAMQNLLETRFGYQSAFHPTSGYSVDKDRVSLATNWAGDNGLFGYTTNFSAEAYERTIVQLPEDKELVLALAGMRKDGAFQVGEVLVFINNWSDKLLKGSIGVVQTPVSDGQKAGHYINIKWVYYSGKITDGAGYHGGFAPKSFRRATKEEIINFYRHGSATLKSDPLPFVAESRKITGYKVPFNLYGGRINAGEVMSKKNSVGHYIMLGITLPAEIVEQWEPVYEELPKVVTVLIGKNRTKCAYVEPGKEIRVEAEKIDVKHIQDLYVGLNTAMNVSSSKFPWPVEYIRAKIGCLEVGADDLKKVLDAYYEKGGKHE